MALILRIGVVVCTLTLALNSTLSAREKYPVRPVKIIVPSAPGGGTDTVARLMAQYFSTALQGSFVIENRPGGGSVIGSEVAARATPDGYSLLAAASTITSLHVTRQSMKFDVTKDFDPISRIVSMPNIIVVNPTLPVKSLEELLALAKTSSTPIAYASPGVASNAHMSMEMFSARTGIKLLHIPYNGVAPALTDVLSGRVPLMLVNLASVRAHIDNGSLRPIAITSGERSKLLPDVPTASEAGLRGFESIQWFGLLAPRGTPTDIIQILNRATREALKTEALTKWVDTESGTAVGNSPLDFGREIAADFTRWTEVGSSAGIVKN